ncbi:hypothetical protein OIDMADRAFT_126317 [Oidiodendron maius Zn]|uniref:DUF7702 domain-containing protein n=1 Tax=Oidiodendron maius (strain Zn) TaxID=913774 RepID=A0A0C3GUS3_OIDMZ|nr:hypothetical protein OIDMADRAFT_126317 [Oidiodendron maius Zn]
MISTPEAIAIAELSVYSPILLLTFIIVFRYGFKRQSGWIYLAIFCIVRIAGAALKILSAEHPQSIDDAEWAAILQSVGISPLLLATFGLLKRITDLVTTRTGGKIGNLIANRANAASLRSRIIQLSHIPIVIGLVLCIVGGTDTGDVKKGLTFTKAGIVIFLVFYIVLAILIAVTARDVGNAPGGERRLYWVIVAALPFLAVRLLWSLIAVFGHDKKFSITGGDPWVNFGMAIVEEFIIVCMYTGLGLTLGKGNVLRE